MSTHPLERRRTRPVGRRFEPRRVAIWCAAIAAVFAAAFGVGHIRRSGEAVVERTPPRLPAVSTPVPAALVAAPAIKLAVVRPAPPAPKPSVPAKSSQPAVTPTVTPTTPAVSTPAPTPTVTPVTPAPEVSKPAAPAPSPSPSPHSSGGSGSGSGTSFESSG